METTIHLTIEDNKVIQILENNGLSPTQAVKLFFSQIAQTGKIPLSFEQSAEVKMPNETTLAAIQEAREGKLTRYSSLEEMMQDIEKWQE